MKKLLFTGGGGAGNESIYRQWCGIYDLHFCDANSSSFDYSLPPEKCHKIPLATASNYVEKLSLLCNQLAIDVLIPGVDEELIYMETIKKNVPGLVCLCPDTHFIEQMGNKYSFIQALLDKELTAPRTTLLSAQRNAESLTYPAIVKPIFGRGSRGVYTVSSHSQLNAYKELFDYKDSQLILQEKIEGDEYTVFISADSAGDMGAIIPVRVVTKRGITLEAETDSNASVIDYCLKFHALFKPVGCYNMQLIRTKNDEIYPFELNPRISTTFCLAIATGYDPIKTLLYGVKNGLYTPEVKCRINRHWFNSITFERNMTYEV